MQGKPLVSPHDVAAALEAISPRLRPVARVPREVPERCPRCDSRAMSGGTDEDGLPEAYCVACGHRVGELTPEQAEALRRDVDALPRGVSGRTRRRG